MAAEVFFADTRVVENRGLLDKTETLFDKVVKGSTIEPGDLVAIKTHFGDPGGTAFVSPLFPARLVKKVKELKGRPFLTDANTLYRGARSEAVSHLITAIRHGFGFEVVGAPVIIADGLTGKDYREIEVRGRHFSKVKIGSAVCHADALVAVSHVTGHSMTGLAGALKNVGMGLGSPGGKQAMHSDVLPVVDVDKCTGCSKCLQWCPTEAITLVEGKATIDEKKCLGCGECVATCPPEAIVINWGTDERALQEKIVEYVWGVLKDKKGKAVFFNFLLNVGPECDCWRWSEAAIVPDIGILSSIDPVAIDQASLDLVNAAPGLKGTRLKDIDSRDKFGSITGVDCTTGLQYAEAVGLGTRKYKLIKVR